MTLPLIFAIVPGIGVGVALGYLLFRKVIPKIEEGTTNPRSFGGIACYFSMVILFIAGIAFEKVIGFFLPLTAIREESLFLAFIIGAAVSFLLVGITTKKNRKG